MQWMNEPDGGLDLLFRELSGRDEQGRRVKPPLFAATGKTPAGGALEQAREWMLDSKKLADKHGLPLISYEGGQHLVAAQGGKLEALFFAANRDPRMGAALSRNLDDWRAAGGQLFVFYTYARKSSRFGPFGLKEDLFDDAAPKWQAVKAMRQQRCWWAACAH
jgi:hypothetical protein